MERVVVGREACNNKFVMTRICKGGLYCFSINQSIMGGISRRARCLAYPTAPLLPVTPRESPCRLPSYTE